MEIPNGIDAIDPTRARVLADAGPEWAEWYLLTPEQRWAENKKLWQSYIAMGGSLEPEVDFQSPFYTAEEYAEFQRFADEHKTRAFATGP